MMGHILSQHPNATSKMRERAQIMARLGDRVFRTLLGAGFEPGFRTQDPRAVRAGFLVDAWTEAADPEQWSLTVIRFDIPGSDILGWIGRYAFALSQANIEHVVNNVGDLSQVGPWAEIVVHYATNWEKVA